MQLTPIDFSADDRNVTQPENRPFICRAKPPIGETAVLLVHGFTGTPWEMAPLARHLATKGITSVAVRLPGHGTTPEDLSRRTFEEWVETVAIGQQFLKNEGNRHIAVGLSTGAMVSIKAHLAHRFDGLALLSPYLRTRHRLASLAGILRHFIHYQKREITENERDYYYARRPVEGIYQLNRLIQSVKNHLPAIMVPTLVACAAGDKTVDPNSAIEIYRRLGSQRKDLHRLGAEVPHVLTTSANPKQADVFTLVSSFVAAITPQRVLPTYGTKP